MVNQVVLIRGANLVTKNIEKKIKKKIVYRIALIAKNITKTIKNVQLNILEVNVNAADLKKL